MSRWNVLGVFSFFYGQNTEGDADNRKGIKKEEIRRGRRQVAVTFVMLTMNIFECMEEENSPSSLPRNDFKNVEQIFREDDKGKDFNGSKYD